MIHNFTDLLRYGDDNAIGELLRDITFPEEGYGCYTTFVVRADARQWSPRERLKYWKKTLLGCEDLHELAKDFTGLGSGYSYEIDHHRIDVCWYWDGDGTLTFLVYDPEGNPMRLLRNDDCKKSYRWESEQAREVET